MNINEFAKLAGVSKSAVSRYFNDGYLAEDKRLLIEKAIEETGYAPNIQAQNIRTRITKLVGVIIPKLSSESCAKVTEGITQILSEAGYEILLVNTANNPVKEVEYLELFRENRVDGVIFLASEFTKTHKNALSKMHIPVVIVGQEYPGFACVAHSDRDAAFALTEIMIENGAQNLGIIGVNKNDMAAGKARCDGFFDALEEHNISVNPSFVAESDFTLESGYEQAKKLFRGKNRPDAIFCATDNIAVGVVQFCKDHKISIPSEVMVTGIGDTRIGRVASTPITTAHFHYRTSGADAAEMLLNALREKKLAPCVTRLGYNIVQRESTAKKVIK